MSGLLNLLTNENVLTLIASIVGGVWTLVQGTGWWQRMKGARYSAAVLALEGGVQYAYRTYTKALLDARADGVLTEEEKGEARRLAIEAAKEYASRHGVDLIATLGAEYLDLWISRIVARLKGEEQLSPEIAGKLEGLGL
jgi:hypothetical protein